MAIHCPTWTTCSRSSSAAGAGTRLFPLTLQRSKPAVPIAGKYRLIDIPISNCLNSGLRRIFVLTQFNSESLNKHIALTYKFDLFSSGFVTVLAAEQTEDGRNWFQGTADAVRQSLRHLRRAPLARTSDPLRRPALPHGLPQDAGDATAAASPTPPWRSLPVDRGAGPRASAS